MDETLGKKIKITILASGFGLRDFKEKNTDENDNVLVFTKEDIEKVIRQQKFYPNQKNIVRQPSRIFLYSMDNLGDEEVVDTIDSTPTLHREKSVLDQLNQS